MRDERASGCNDRSGFDEDARFRRFINCIERFTVTTDRRKADTKATCIGDSQERRDGRRLPDVLCRPDDDERTRFTRLPTIEELFCYAQGYVRSASTTPSSSRTMRNVPCPSNRLNSGLSCPSHNIDRYV